MESPRTTLILGEFLNNPKNAEAFGKFAAKFQPRMKRYFLGRGLQEADADDLTAAILLRFFEKDVFTCFVFQTKDKFNGFLNRVVKNALLTFVRDRGRRPEAWSVGRADAQDALPEIAEGIVGNLQTICEEDRVLVRVARQRVEKRIEDQTKVIFRLLVDEERAVDGICRELEVTKYVVWKARSRVMRMLREEFSKLNNSTGD
jgi:DNA-directed RNA polymerase specialized sigma24 family protein